VAKRTWERTAGFLMLCLFLHLSSAFPQSALFAQAGSNSGKALKHRMLKVTPQQTGDQLIVADFNVSEEGDEIKQRVDGTSSTFQIGLTNTSPTQTVTFSGVTPTTPYTATTDCTSLAPGKSCHVFVNFTPTSICDYLGFGTITVADDDPGGNLELSVEGWGADSAIKVDDLTDSTLTPSALAQTLVGPGVQISNVTYTGAPRAAGRFTSTSNILGFTDGIVLSSGSVRNVAGPNCEDGMSVDNGQPGDSDLDTIVGEGNTTNDASVLQFDFVPTSSVISFQYVFASEEYNDFVGEFNDVFGFFLTDNTTNVTTNIALIPGTNLPVSINNVNNGNPNLDPPFPPTNPQYYINNQFIYPTAAPLDTEMNGLTVVFTAQSQVTPGHSYHIKLAVADANDFALDSNVFLQTGSLVSADVTLTPGTLAFGNQAVDTTSATQPITVTNVGTETVNISSIVASANFTQTNNCPAALSPAGSDGSSCTVNVAFAPTASGSLNGNLTATYTTTSNNTPQTQVATLTGTGTGTADTLTVTEAGTGTGSVTSAPAGITCPSTCSAGFASGTEITLTATPASGSTFTGWGGATCEGTGTCTLTISAATSVTANFSAQTSNFALTVSEAGNGTGTVSSSPAGIACPETCTANFASGTQVTLSAVASSGSSFAGWSGACTGGGSCVVTMTAAESVIATFNSGSGVTISIPSGGSSTATSTPGGTAYYGLVISGGAGVTGTVQLGCVPSSPTISCQVIPSSVVLNGKPVEVAFGIQTFCTGATTSAGFVPGGTGAGLGLLLLTLILGGAVWTMPRDRRVALTFAVLVLVAMGTAACGGGLAKGPNGATQPGTYTLTITATLNGQTQTLPNFLTLVVK
jgi:Divergent InlB B-repeat domain